jgi:hypothetical protein
MREQMAFSKVHNSIKITPDHLFETVLSIGKFVEKGILVFIIIVTKMKNLYLPFYEFG